MEGDAHTKTIDELVNQYKTDVDTGLPDDLVTKYQEKYGPNGKYQYFDYFIYHNV